MDAGPNTDEIGTGPEFASDLPGNCAKTAAPTIADNCSTDLATDGIRDQHLCLRYVRREKVYRHRPTASLSAASRQMLKDASPSHWAGTPAQADRRTRPRLRRAFKMALPARVDMRWRKP